MTLMPGHTPKKVDPLPVKHVGMPAARQCRCPDKDCSGWRASRSNGGGHITRERASELLQEQE